MSHIKVMLVDDHHLFRQGLRDVIETDDALDVVAEAADGKLAIQLAYQHQPDVILMDINLPTINGLQVTRKIKAGLSEAQVITITGYDDAQQVLQRSPRWGISLLSKGHHARNIGRRDSQCSQWLFCCWRAEDELRGACWLD